MTNSTQLNSTQLNSTQRKYLCGFADNRLKKSLERFQNQAMQMKIYDEIYLYTEDNLDKDFYNYFKDKFHLRGFGYWVWKPQIILQTLSKINEGDILQYTDVGCHLNINGLKRLKEYFEITNQSETGLLTFNMPYFTEKQWTKGDLFDYFNVRYNENIFPSQIAATVIFIKKCSQSIEIIKKYLKVFYDDFSLVDDSKSKSKNFPEFQSHRHDQSVWSILAKINNVPCITHAEQWAEKFETLNEYPILVKRDKVFKERKIKKVFRLIKNIPKIIRKYIFKIKYTKKKYGT